MESDKPRRFVVSVNSYFTFHLWFVHFRASLQFFSKSSSDLLSHTCEPFKVGPISTTRRSNPFNSYTSLASELIYRILASIWLVILFVVGDHYSAHWQSSAMRI